MANNSINRIRDHRVILTALIFWMSIIPAPGLFAQPYFDLFSVRYISSPEGGKTGKDKNPTRLDYLNISATFPIQFKNNQDALVLSPFFERWTSRVQTISNYREFHYGVVLPVTLIKSIPHSKWNLMSTVIVRMNDADINRNGQWQLGGALLAARNVNRNFTYKLGIYLNSDFFGLFMVPLVGIDWHINEKTNLFGVLPASLTLEYKLGKQFYTGSVFRTFTNSYHDTGTNYLRIDENQLGVYLDYYPTNRILLNLEAGHSILRKLRGGGWHDINNNWNADNNMYFKFSVAYRFRIRK